MSINIVNGNILNATENIIVHQVNGLGVMGGGLAKQIRNKYPKVYMTYRRYAKSHNDPIKLLGTNLMVQPDGNIVNNAVQDTATIISNVFGQAFIGTSEKQTDETALKIGLTSVAEFAKANNLSVAIPYGIGCGLGGGDWSVIKPIIEAVFKDCSVTIYKFQ